MPWRLWLAVLLCAGALSANPVAAQTASVCQVSGGQLAGLVHLVLFVEKRQQLRKNSGGIFVRRS